MSRTFIPVEEAFRAWDADPAFRMEYDRLGDEFALAAALVDARTTADLTQVEVAIRMGTTQAAIARLESGRFKPSTRTLERFAQATGTRLKISFERPTQARALSPGASAEIPTGKG